MKIESLSSLNKPFILRRAAGANLLLFRRVSCTKLPFSHLKSAVDNILNCVRCIFLFKVPRQQKESYWIKMLANTLSRWGQAEIRTGFEELYRVMSQREEFRWMMLRIRRMAEPWVGAIRSLAAKQNLARRRRKKVGVIYTEKREKAFVVRWWQNKSEYCHRLWR